MTVSGESPVIDTTATRIQTNYDQQMLSSIPNARDMWSLLATTPSVTLNRVDVGGATAGTQTTYFAYGYSGQNRPLIEGINTTEGTAAAGFYLDYGSFEEVFIGAAGNSAEMPNPGVLTQFVGKSGGNRPSVSLYYDYENEDIQGTQPRPPIRSFRHPARRSARTAIASPSTRTSTSASAARSSRDRMWGHFSYLNQQTSVAAPPAGSFLDGTPFNTKLFNYTGKATYQVNQANKFIGYLQHGTKEQPNRTDVNTASRRRCTSPPIRRCCRPRRAGSTRVNGTARIGQNMFVEFRAGQFGYNFGLDSNTDDTRYESLTTQRGARRRPRLGTARRRNQYTGAVSYFKDNFAGGSHNFKVGGEYMDEKGETLWNAGLRGQRRPLRQRRAAGPLSATTPVRVRLYHQLRQLERAGDHQRRSSPTPGRSTS